LHQMGADPAITPQSLAVVQRIVNDVSNGAATVPNAHVWRRMASNAAMSRGSESAMASQLIGMIDDMVDNLAQNAGDDLLRAISVYHRAAKMSTLESAIATAADQASGLENGLRIQFARILKSPNLSRGFTEAEKQAMRTVNRGTFSSNMLRLLGTFGVPTDQARSWLGAFASGSLGHMVGNLPGSLAMLGMGTAARKGAEVLTRNAAERALRVVGTANIPQVPMPNPMLTTPVEGLLGRAAVAIPEIIK